MWEASHSLVARAAPADVWELWADAERWPDWNRDIARAELEGPFGVGSTAKVKFRRSATMRFAITAFERERLFVDEARLPGARMGHEHRVEPEGEGVRITNRLYIDGPATAVYALLMGRRMRASVSSFVEAERELAEVAATKT